MVKLVVVVSPSGKKHAVGETNATTKLNRNLFSKKGCKIVNDLSFRYRFFFKKHLTVQNLKMLFRVRI